MILRSQHWTDSPVDGRDRSRRIENWSNYRLPSGLWAAASPDVDEASGAPPDWQGQYEFTHRNLASALQTFVGDSTDPSNTALWGMRLSARPGVWLNFKAIAIDNAAPPVIDRTERTATWSNLWDFCDLKLTLCRHKVVKEVVLRPGHRASFRFTMRYPAGFSHSIAGDVLRLFDAEGVEVFRTFPAHGQDADGNPIRVSLVASPDVTIGGRTFPTVRVVPNAEDLAGAVYPVTIDPTATITGTTNIEDAYLDSGGPTFNYGGRTTIRVNDTSARGLLRCISAAIPAGSISGNRMAVYNSSVGQSTTARLILAANDWVEGALNGANQAGSCNWNYAVDNSLAWAGSAGCSTVETDYTNTGLVIVSGSAGAYKVWALPASWAALWRDTSTSNNGVRLSASASSVSIFTSTEGASNQPYWEIDYTVGGGVAPIAHHYRQRRI